MVDDAFTAMCESAQRQPPRVAVVLGSGLGAIAARVRVIHAIPFEAIPGLEASTVEGHADKLILGDWCGQRVLAYCGRIHSYEGHSRDQVVAPIRLAARLGAREIVLTNAAGGIRDDLLPSTLMTISAHLDLTQSSFWRCGVRLRSLCTPRLKAMIDGAAQRLGMSISEGTYGAVLGPTYETPAEIRALRSLGVEAVGMSTAAEIEAAAELGLECLAVSCITNRAAGLSDQRLTHEEVLAGSQRQAQRLGDLIEAVISERES